MFRLSLLLFCCIFLNIPITTYAYFDEMVQQTLRQDILPQLESPSLEQRTEAINTLLNFPEWSLPLIREAIQDPSLQSIHWRLAHLLGVLGTLDDIPLILLNLSLNEDTYQRSIWKGASERIFWRYRKTSSRKFIISRLRFLQESRTGQMVSGTLVYKIVNPDRDARLIQAKLGLLHGQLEDSFELPYHWVKAGQNVEYSIPLTFQWGSRKTIRLDLEVSEVGIYQPNQVTHLSIKKNIR